MTEDTGSWSVSARAHATRFSVQRGICLLDVIMRNSWVKRRGEVLFCFALFSSRFFCFDLLCFRHASLFV